MGGGGGDDYAAQAAAQEAKRQAARDALNLSFGVAPTGAAPDKANYYKKPTIFGGGGEHGSSQFGSGGTVPQNVFDQAGYDAAVAKYNSDKLEAEKNKAARDALYGAVRQNAFDAGKRNLDDKRAQAARDLKFALFAQGLNGGSVDIDQNSDLGRVYDQGTLDLGAKADAAKSSFQTNDENTRLGLLQSIDAGLDQGSALSSALAQMKNNADSAAASAQGTSLGDLFTDAGLLYTKSNVARGKQDATSYWNTNYGSAGRRNTGSSGIVTSTG